MSTLDKKIRVRFAPSPTGFLHVGGLRTALYNYLFAKQQDGDFILRLEDTDQARFVDQAEADILKVLTTFGLKWDEGPIKQSDRLGEYKKYAEQLLAQGMAYRDYHTPEEISNLKKQIGDSGRLNREVLSMPEIEQTKREKGGHPYVIRFIIPDQGQTTFDDLIRGQISIANNTLEDFIILKSDGYPTYNFANVIDDRAMAISHVIRGEEFIPSTPKHILLYRALNWPEPQFAHLPLLLNKDRAKLSKREGDVAVSDFLTKGYLKEAILNFVALLGWHPSQSEKEIYSLPELIADFRLENVQKAGAIFDLEKLNWFQKQWVTNINHQNREEFQNHPLYENFKNVFRNEYEEIDDQTIELLWPHLVERYDSPENLSTLIKELGYLFDQPDYRPEILVWKKSNPEKTRKALTETKTFLDRLKKEDWQSPQNLEQKLKDQIIQSEFDNGTVLWSLRVALSGQERSLPPFDILYFLYRLKGAEEIAQRLDKAISKLS